MKPDDAYYLMSSACAVLLTFWLCLALLGMSAGVHLPLTNFLFVLLVGILHWLPALWMIFAVLLGAFALAVFCLTSPRDQPSRALISARLRRYCFGAFAVSLLLCRTELPRRVAFLLSLSAFEAAELQASHNPGYQASEVGLFLVTECATDERGGTHFIIDDSAGMAFLWAPTYGFVFEPNSESTPFGDGPHKTRRMWGDWYYFHQTEE